MRALFQCKKYEVLSMDGLRYETKLDRLYNADKQTHVPIFHMDKDLFVQVGNEVRKFVPKLIRYGFRYYDNDTARVIREHTLAIARGVEEISGCRIDVTAHTGYACVENDDALTELAKLVGVSRNTVSSIETGQFNPTAKLALILCIALEKKFEDLFYF